MQPLEPIVQLLGAVALRHEIVLGTELRGTTRHDFGVDAVGVAAMVEHQQVLQ